MNMKYRFLAICCLWGCLLTQALAQPSWTKKASKAVFTLKTFQADGSLLASSNGFFIDEDGRALSTFMPFKGAARAVVIDAQGKEWPVVCMLGANETYDVAKFRVETKKPQAVRVSVTPLSEEQIATVLPYREVKQVKQGKVLRVEHFNGNHAYYTLSMPSQEYLAGCPLLNEQGEAVGIMQPAASAGDKQSYAVSALFADSLTITGLSFNDKTLRATTIKKALPEQQDQALLALYMGSSATDSTTFATMVDDFIAQFPQSADGYLYRAQLHLKAYRFSEAEKDMEQAVKVAEKKDDAHYNYARLIYEKEVTMSDKPYAAWSLDKAMEEATKAYELNPMPLYRYQQATILYAQKRFDEAKERFLELKDTPLRSAEVFYDASRCAEQLKDTTAQLALMDSVMAMFSQPYLQEAAPYLLARAQVRMGAGKSREAVADLNDYEKLMRTKLNDRFYYIRYQADMGGRLFQMALNDIDKAIELNPTYDLYLAEKASLQIRVGLTDEAAETARRCVEMAPNYSDGYLFLGLAQCLKGNKDEGLKNLQKAKELGDPQADELIEKYSK